MPAARAVSTLALLLSALACLSPRAAAQRGTVASLLSSGGVPDATGADFDVLARLLAATGLVDALNDADADLTVFAPTDAAFAKAARDLGCPPRDEEHVIECLGQIFAALGDAAAEQVLRYHVLPEGLMLDDVLKRASLKTVEGTDIKRTGQEPFELQDKAIKLANPNIIPGRSDRKATNGVVHVIDRVLFPLDLNPSEVKRLVKESKRKKDTKSKQPKDDTVLGLLTGTGSGTADEGNFDILTALISGAGLANTIRTAKGVTVFAPTDAAFGRSARDLGFSPRANGSDEDAIVKFFQDGFDDDALENTLKYHVVPDELTAPEVLRKTAIPTLQGEDITRSDVNRFALQDKAPSLPDPKLVVDRLDQTGSNGIVHVIDRVLFPVNVTKESVSEEAARSAGSDGNSTDADSETAESTLSDDDDDDSPCFPASALVHLADGTDIPLRDLNAGHSIRFSVSGQVSHEDAHSPVYFFSHRVHETLHNFLRIQTSNGHALVLSANHYLYANGKMVAADAVKAGDRLETLDGWSAVVNVRNVRERGLVAPHTLHGDIVVNRVRASTYTRSVHPTLAHVLLGPVRALVRLGVSAEPLGGLLYGGADRLARLVPSGP